MARIATLFRYRSLSGDGFRYTQDIFFRRRLYWPYHSQLNDPAEGVYRMARRLTQGDDGRWYAPREPLLRSDDVRVLSFSEDPKHPLMWSHYADAHRGICIGFRRDSFPEVTRVRYPRRVPRLDPALSVTRRRASALLTKRSPWSHEREWRLIDIAGTAADKPYIPLKANSIRQVIFGARMSPDDRKWVAEWLRLSGCHANVREARFSGAAAKLHLIDVA